MTDEAQFFRRDEPGEELSRDPATDRLTQPGGFGPAYEDRINYGLYNGAFARGPNDPTVNIDPFGSAGSNFLPNWRFVQSSNTNITAQHVADIQSPSGSNARFIFASGAATDEAFLEQVVSISGSRGRGIANIVRARFLLVTDSTTTHPQPFVDLQYLRADGSPVGNSTGGLSGWNAGAAARGTLAYVVGQADFNSAARGSPPAQAFYLRVRIGVRRGSMAATATATVDVTDVRNDAGREYVLISEQNATSIDFAASHWEQQSGGVYLYVQGLTALAKYQLLSGRLQLPGPLDIPETASPSLPGAGVGRFYAGTDEMPHYGADDGTDYSMLRDVRGAFIFRGILNVVLASSPNDWAPAGITTAAVVTIDMGAVARTITGISATGFVEGQALYLLPYNTSALNLTLADKSASSLAGNRFSCPGGVNLTVRGTGGVMVIYLPTHATNNPWSVLAV